MSVLPSYPMNAHAVRALVRAAVPAPSQGVPQPGLHTGGPCIAVIGAFDGVHLGHRELVEACVRDARAQGARAVVVTFDPDPSEVLRGEEGERRLLAVSDRACLCSALGADEVLVLPFTRELAALVPEAFVRHLVERLGGLVRVHVGENFRFGALGAGDAALLSACGEALGFDVVTHSLLERDGLPVSSTRVRTQLGEGRVSDAAVLLGRHHFVRGTVAHGRGEGTSFGFPTANVCCDPRFCLPCEGVYACLVTDGAWAWPAAANVGAPPTFDMHREAFLEANLLGFSGDLYGRELAVVFVEWLRASRTFSSLDELATVVLGNIGWVRDNLGDAGVRVDL